MNRQDILLQARAITELTTDDAADSTVLLFAREGFERVINLERRWPFYEQSSTFASVNGTSTYALSAIQSDTFREIVSIKDGTTGELLDFIDFEQGDRVWQNTTSGRPQHWSLWDQNIVLWPTPSSAITYTVRGYRKATEWWESDTDEIDCDERLHMAVLYFVLSRLYQIQEDAELTGLYAQTFAEAATSAHREIMRSSSNRPLVLNRGVPGARSSIRGWNPIFLQV